MIQKPQRPTSLEHIVPAWFLSNFCDEDGTICVYERNREVRRSVPRRVCAEHNFYEFQFFETKSSNAYELWLADIESQAKAVLPFLTKGLKINPEQARTWAFFVASLFIRTRKVRSQISGAMLQRMRAYTGTEGYVRDLQHDLLKLGELHFVDELRSRVDLFQAEVEKTPYYHVSGIPRHTALLADTLLKMNWHTICASQGSFFVTTDCPVITLQRNIEGWSEGAGFARKNVAVLLALTPGKVFAASSFFGFKQEATPRYVDAINLSAIRFAHRNVFADRADERINTLVNESINEVVFGKNAFVPPTD